MQTLHGRRTTLLLLQCTTMRYMQVVLGRDALVRHHSSGRSTAGRDQETTMSIVKFVRDIIAEALSLQRDMTRRQPHIGS